MASAFTCMDEFRKAAVNFVRLPTQALFCGPFPSDTPEEACRRLLCCCFSSWSCQCCSSGKRLQLYRNRCNLNKRLRFACKNRRQKHWIIFTTFNQFNSFKQNLKVMPLHPSLEYKFGKKCIASYRTCDLYFPVSYKMKVGHIRNDCVSQHLQKHI